MLVIRTSQLTGRTHGLEIAITLAQLKDWQNGTPIQVAMPEIDRAEREFILTGITPQEWLDAFGQQEPEEE